MTRFLSSLCFAVLTVVLSFVILVLVVNPPRIEPTVPTFENSDAHRLLSYEIRGDKSRPNCIIWLHGLLSSRFEVLAISESVLKDVDAFVVGFDRPGYGDSTMQRGRDYQSAAEDILTVADGIGAEKFFVAGVSAGGSYAWAAASLLPGRLRGVLLLSAAGPQGLLPREDALSEFSRLEGTWRAFFQRMALEQPMLTGAALWVAETYVGGRALYTGWLEDVARTVMGRMQEVDARCLMRAKHAEYTLKVLPESLKQNIATPVIQDLLLIHRPWTFNISQVPQHLASATHIWHGSDDAMVPAAYAKAFKDRVPAAALEIVPKGGHSAYWVCDITRQREILSRLIKSGKPG